jgi:hypothetical protein
MKSDFSKKRRDLLKSACTLAGTSALLSIGGSLNAFAAGGATPSPQATKMQLHKFVIEREIPGAGKLSAGDLQGISQKSCSVLKEMGPQIQWVESYVCDDRIYCIYLATSAGLLREHAKRGGFPANRISEVRTMIDPTTAGP